MEKTVKYYVLQRKKDGKWLNDSPKFFISGLTGAMKCYTHVREVCPTEKYRIAKGKAKIRI